MNSYSTNIYVQIHKRINIKENHETIVHLRTKSTYNPH